MKHSLVILVALAACVTDPDVEATEQAVVADEVAECTAEPELALDVIEQTFGAGSVEHVEGLNCWRAYDREINRANAFLNWCLAQPPRQRPNCYQIYADMRFIALRNFYNCIVFRSRWSCPWGGHTQPWGSDHTQDW